MSFATAKDLDGFWRGFMESALRKMFPGHLSVRQRAIEAQKLMARAGHPVSIRTAEYWQNQLVTPKPSHISAMAFMRPREEVIAEIFAELDDTSELEAIEDLISRFEKLREERQCNTRLER